MNRYRFFYTNYAEQVLDPNTEVLHWLQVLQLHKTVYNQPDPVVEKAVNQSMKETEKVETDAADKESM